MEWVTSWGMPCSDHMTSQIPISIPQKSTKMHTISERTEQPHNLPLWIGQLCWKAFAGREVEQMCWCVKPAERPSWMRLCQTSLRGHARPLSEPAQSPLISDPINKMYSDSIKQPSCCAGGQKPLGENHGKHSFNCPSTFLKNIKLH